MLSYPKILSASGVLPKHSSCITNGDKLGSELSINYRKAEKGERHIWRLDKKDDLRNLLEESLMDALKYAYLSAGDIDFLILSKVWNDNIMGLESASLAKSIDGIFPSVGINAGTDGGCLALNIASSMIKAKQYDRIAVVAGCNYGHFFKEDDPVRELLSDGAACMILGAGNGPEIIATHSVSTAHYQVLEYVAPPKSAGEVYIKNTPGSGSYIYNNIQKTIFDCCYGVCQSSDYKLDEVDNFYIYDPVDWIHDIAVKALGVEKGKVFSTFCRYGSLGPALNTIALIEMAKSMNLRVGQHIITMGFGPTSTATACLLRWDDFPCNIKLLE